MGRVYRKSLRGKRVNINSKASPKSKARSKQVKNTKNNVKNFLKIKDYPESSRIKARVLVSMPTIPGREEFALKVIDGLLKQDIDVIVIHLNGHRNAKDFPKNDRIAYIFNGPGAGPIYRFNLSRFDFEYLFTVDDDIDYPEDYIEKSIEYMKEFSNDSVISYHTHYWKDKETYDYRCRTTYRLDSQSDDYLTFGYGGCGASVYGPQFNAIFKQTIDLSYQYNDDVWMSSTVSQNGISIIRPPTDLNWLRPQSPHPRITLYDKAKSKNFKKRNLLLERAIKSNNSFDIWKCKKVGKR